uniref:multinuclear nonheme iron-dependent oxidase n=1 Tax=Pseudomonas aeruginosa TaxID=287 RepID=UPI0004F33336
MQREFVSGAGLGLRRALLEPLGAGDGVRVDFLEVAPENWIGIGGRLGRQFRELTLA